MAEQRFTVADAAALCRGHFTGSTDEAGVVIDGVAAIHTCGPTKVSWLTDDRHGSELADCPAAAVVGSKSVAERFPRTIVCDDPEMSMVRLLGAFHVPLEAPSPGIHPSAVVDSTARIGEGAAIGPLCVVKSNAVIGARSVLHGQCSVGADVAIGDDCTLYDQVVLYDRVTIRNRVILHSHVTIGADGFGYIFRDGAHHRYPHIGSVLIEDDVEIGANTCIDRGKVGPTTIGAGCKIDNLVQVGHNVEIGPLSVVAGQCGFGGSSKLGTGVLMAGHAGVVDGKVVADGSMVGVKACVFNHTKPGERLMGVPAVDDRQFKRDIVRRKKLEKLFDRVAELEARLASIQAGEAS